MRGTYFPAAELCPSAVGMCAYKAGVCPPTTKAFKAGRYTRLSCAGLLIVVSSFTTAPARATEPMTGASNPALAVAAPVVAPNGPPQSADGGAGCLRSHPRAISFNANARAAPELAIAEATAATAAAATAVAAAAPPAAALITGFSVSTIGINLATACK